MTDRIPLGLPANPGAPATSKSLLPDRNTLAGGLTAVLGWLILFGLNRVGVAIPVELQAAIPALIGYVLTYMLPPSAKNVADRVNNAIVRLANADQENPTTAVVVPKETALAQAHTDMALGLVPVAVLPPGAPVPLKPADRASPKL